MSGAVKFVKDVRRLASTFLTGTVVYIDPASGGSSQPGWAYSEGGVLLASGVLKIGKDHITNRLVDLYDQLSYPLFKYGAPDLLVVEELRGRMVHPFLHWSVGVTVVALTAEAVLEIPITCWKAFAEADADYTKGDEADARAFAHTCLALARGEPLPFRTRTVDRRVGRTKRAVAAKGRARTKRAAATRAGGVGSIKRKTPGRDPPGTSGRSLRTTKSKTTGVRATKRPKGGKK